MVSSFKVDGVEMGETALCRYPLFFNPRGCIRSRDSLDIYGAHLDITLLNSLPFDTIGGELGLFPNALGPPGFEPGTKGL